MQPVVLRLYTTRATLEGCYLFPHALPGRLQKTHMITASMICTGLLSVLTCDLTCCAQLCQSLPQSLPSPSRISPSDIRNVISFLRSSFTLLAHPPRSRAEAKQPDSLQSLYHAVSLSLLFLVSSSQLLRVMLLDISLLYGHSCTGIAGVSTSSLVLTGCRCSQVSSRTCRPRVLMVSQLLPDVYLVIMHCHPCLVLRALLDLLLSQVSTRVYGDMARGVTNATRSAVWVLNDTCKHCRAILALLQQVRAHTHTRQSHALTYQHGAIKARTHT